MAIRQFYAPVVVTPRVIRGQERDTYSVAPTSTPLVASAYDSEGGRMIVTVLAGTEVPGDWTPCLPPEEEEGYEAPSEV